MPTLQLIYFGNTVQDYLVFLAVLLGSLAVVKVIDVLAMKRLRRWNDAAATAFSELVVKGVGRFLLPLAYFGAFYVSTRLLVLGPFGEKAVNIIAAAFMTAMAAVFVSSVLVFSFHKYWEKNRTETTNELAIRWMGSLIRAIIWGLAAILFLDNIGVKINTLIAGLGIGGLAVAFAAQSILADLFCFVTILFDRPFEVGDFIVAGPESGTVEHIGIKTTRLRSLSGEQLIFSNTDLTSARIQNFKTLEKRRVKFTIGVTYDTPLHKMKEIPQMIRGIVEELPDTAFGRAHFTAFSDYSMDFEVVYFVLSNDYDRYMDIHQSFNLQLKEAFEREGIEFAFPTHTIINAG